MADDFCVVTRVDVFARSKAVVCYSVNGLCRGQVEVNRKTWAGRHPGYWPPGEGDVFDPESGELKMRPR